MSTSAANSATSSTSTEKPIRIAAVGLDHAHIFGQLTGLLEQGCELVGTATDDPSAAVAQEVRRRWPDAPAVEDPDRLLEDESIDLVVTAAVPVRRAPIALAALRNGKDVVTDKPGCTTPEQLADLRTAWPRRVGSGRSPSPSASRSRRSRAPVSWCGRVGSAAWCRPWVWARTGSARTWPAAGPAPTGSTTRCSTAASSTTSPPTRSTSFCGSPAPPAPTW